MKRCWGGQTLRTAPWHPPSSYPHPWLPSLMRHVLRCILPPVHPPLLSECLSPDVCWLLYATACCLISLGEPHAVVLFNFTLSLLSLKWPPDSSVSAGSILDGLPPPSQHCGLPGRLLPAPLHDFRYDPLLPWIVAPHGSCVCAWYTLMPAHYLKRFWTHLLLPLANASLLILECAI